MNGGLTESAKPTEADADGQRYRYIRAHKDNKKHSKRFCVRGKSRLQWSAQRFAERSGHFASFTRRRSLSATLVRHEEFRTEAH